MMSGLLLIAIGAIWPHFHLIDRHLLWLKWSWIYSSHANWIGCLIGGMLGAGRTTPVAAAGMEGSAVAEAIVLVLLASVGVVAVFAAGLSWWGVRRRGGEC